MLKIVTVILLTAVIRVHGGTILLQDGEQISGVKIISIESGRITVEKDGAMRTFPLSRLQGYSHIDLKSESGFVENLADYRISVGNIDFPSFSGSRQGSSGNVVIPYRIVKTGEHRDRNLVKVPYFYLYLLYSGGNDYGHRHVTMYFYPRQARLRSSQKKYDRVAIMAALSNFQRPTINLKYRDNQFEDLRATISIPNPGERKLLAWRLEVYGNTDLVYEKTENTFDARVGQREWWKYH